MYIYKTYCELKKRQQVHELSYSCSAKPSRYSTSSFDGITTDSISGQANPGSQMRPSKCAKEKEMKQSNDKV